MIRDHRQSLLFISIFIFPCYAFGEVTATIVDIEGVEYEVTNLTYTEDSPYDRDYGNFEGDVGPIVKIKEFDPSGEGIKSSTYEFWPLFELVKSIKITTTPINDDTEGVIYIINLTDGSHYKNKIAVSLKNPKSAPKFQGNTEFGKLSLPINKTSLITIKTSLPMEFTTKDLHKGVIELRDGSVIYAKDIRRCRRFRSGYINVPSKNKTEKDLWIEIKKGVATFKKKVDFTEIKEITFEELRDDVSDKRRIEIILKNGDHLSGSYIRWTKENQLWHLLGFVGMGDKGIFYIDSFNGYLGSAIKTIKFTD